MTGSDFWKVFAPVGGLLILFVVAFFAVYKKDISLITATNPPTLELVSGSEIETDQSEVPITGIVRNSNKLTIAGKEVTVGTDGGFSTLVPVNLGANNIDIAVGSSGAVKSTVRVTRAEVQKAVASATTVTSPTSADLTTSGPAETIVGSFGLAAMCVSLYVYRRSVAQNTLQNAKNSL